MVVEIIDRIEKIEEVLPHLEEMIDDGLVTLERVQVLRYHAKREDVEPER